MQRRLTIVRHAKSDWGDFSVPDMERPLSPRGLRDAPAMGERMRERGDRPDLIVCSSALRARTTAEILAEALEYTSDRLLVEPAIYEAPVSQLLDVVRGCPDRAAHVMMVGHNPGSQQFIQLLTGEPWGHFVTCGVADLLVEVETWEELAPAMAKLQAYWYPKLFQ